MFLIYYTSTEATNARHVQDYLDVLTKMPDNNTCFVFTGTLVNNKYNIPMILPFCIDKLEKIEFLDTVILLLFSDLIH